MLSACLSGLAGRADIPAGATFMVRTTQKFQKGCRSWVTVLHPFGTEVLDKCWYEPIATTQHMGCTPKAPDFKVVYAPCTPPIPFWLVLACIQKPPRVKVKGYMGQGQTRPIAPWLLTNTGLELYRSQGAFSKCRQTNRQMHATKCIISLLDGR